MFDERLVQKIDDGTIVIGDCGIVGGVLLFVLEETFVDITFFVEDFGRCDHRFCVTVLKPGRIIRLLFFVRFGGGSLLEIGYF